MVKRPKNKEEIPAKAAVAVIKSLRTSMEGQIPIAGETRRDISGSLTFFAIREFGDGVTLELVRQSTLASPASLREDRGLRFVISVGQLPLAKYPLLSRARTYIDGDDVRHCRERGQSSAYLLEDAGTFHRIGLSQQSELITQQQSSLSTLFHFRNGDCEEAYMSRISKSKHPAEERAAQPLVHEVGKVSKSAESGPADCGS